MRGKGVVIFCITALLISGVLYARASDPTQSEVTGENRVDLKDVEAVVDTLDSMGYKKVLSEVLNPPTVVCNNEGDKIFIWSYTCDNPERNKEGTPALVCDEVFNPETAETSREIQVGNVSGTLYEKEERAYLIWSPVGDLRSVTLVIDYSPNAVTEEALIKMAISCRPDAA